MRSPVCDICVIEDDPLQRKLLVAQLTASGYSVIEVDAGEAGLQAIYHNRPRVAISDINLPDITGIEVCRQIRSDPSLDSIFVILITSEDDEGRRNTAFEAGADDFLRKPHDFEQVRARVRSGLRFHRLQERLRHAAITDGLTGLWNHSHFRDLLNREFLRTRRYGGVAALIMMDLDHFKAINDTFGHETGNLILRQTARHLERQVRGTDLIARYGGEEFAVICPETTLDEAEQLAERIRRSLPQCVRSPEHPQLVLRASFGVAGSDDPRAHAQSDLVNLADQALYASKRAGRDRVTIASPTVQPPEPESQPLEEVDRLRKEIVGLTMQTKELCLQSVWALIQALEARDGYSAWHSRSVSLYTKWLVDEAGWSRPMRVAATNAAMLHDLGKIGVPDALLLKPHSLQPQEAAVMRQVPLITCRILEPLRVFETEIVIIRHVREHFDGAGYPDGLTGQSIPIGSRLLAVAEAFDSITCNRAYRAGRTMDEALAVLRAAAGSQFDPEFVELLAQCIRKSRARWQNQIDKARIEMPGDRPALMDAG